MDATRNVEGAIRWQRTIWTEAAKFGDARSPGLSKRANGYCLGASYVAVDWRAALTSHFHVSTCTSCHMTGGSWRICASRFAITEMTSLVTSDDAWYMIAPSSASAHLCSFPGCIGCHMWHIWDSPVRQNANGLSEISPKEIVSLFVVKHRMTLFITWCIHIMLPSLPDGHIMLPDGFWNLPQM